MNYKCLRGGWIGYYSQEQMVILQMRYIFILLKYRTLQQM